MSTHVEVSAIKTCDWCQHMFGKTIPPVAFYDARTIYGQWANLCEDCFKSVGVGRLGTGFGQELIYPEGLVDEFRAARTVEALLGGVEIA